MLPFGLSPVRTCVRACVRECEMRWEMRREISGGRTRFRCNPGRRRVRWDRGACDEDIGRAFRKGEASSREKKEKQNGRICFLFLVIRAAAGGGKQWMRKG